MPKLKYGTLGSPLEDSSLGIPRDETAVERYRRKEKIKSTERGVAREKILRYLPEMMLTLETPATIHRVWKLMQTFCNEPFTLVAVRGVLHHLRNKGAVREIGFKGYVLTHPEKTREEVKRLREYESSQIYHKTKEQAPRETIPSFPKPNSSSLDS